MWTIVCFETDNTVDVVPNFWYKNGFCEWPNKTNRIDSKTSVKRRVNPDEIHFKKYKARALLTNIETYQEAELKATKAQLTSDLSSNDDEKCIQKYRKTKTIVTGKKDEVVSQQKLPNPPEFEEYEPTESIVADDSDQDKDYNVPTKDIFTQLMWDNESNTIDDKLPKRNITFENSLQSSTKIKKTAHNNMPSTSYCNKNLESVNDCQNSQPEMSVPLSTSTPEYESDQSFKKYLKRSLATLKYDVENVQRRLDGLETILEKINEKLVMQPNTSIMMTNTSDEDIIFIENETDLNKMEDKLINDPLYRCAVIRTLSRFLSNNLAETIRKMMQKLFSDSFLMNYSFIGFKGKNQFSTLQCCTVIFDAVRSLKKFADVPNMDIEKPVKNWMAQAAQREKIKNQKLASK